MSLFEGIAKIATADTYKEQGDYNAKLAETQAQVQQTLVQMQIKNITDQGKAQVGELAARLAQHGVGLGPGSLGAGLLHTQTQQILDQVFATQYAGEAEVLARKQAAKTAKYEGILGQRNAYLTGSAQILKGIGETVLAAYTTPTPGTGTTTTGTGSKI